MLCCGFVGRGVKYVVLPLVFFHFLLAISRDPGDREPSHSRRKDLDHLILRPGELSSCHGATPNNWGIYPKQRH